MSQNVNISPRADFLMGAMRSIGYSFESAVSDVVDNSISAGAKNIKILLPRSPNDSMALGILDDGCGMTSEELCEAMRYGCVSSENVRDAKDLGRFGLGLKAASLSQCKILIVASVKDKQLSIYAWDYNHVKTCQKWMVIRYNIKEDAKYIKDIPYIDLLNQDQNGTLVVWQDFDVLIKSHSTDIFHILDNFKDSLGNSISWTFHKIIQKGVHIYLNEYEIPIIDPFLSNHNKTTQTRTQSIVIKDGNGNDQLIKVTPYVLPYMTDLTKDDKKLMGGCENMRSKQGFYIYRNDRLIIHGTWYGLSNKLELTKNARICVEIPNTLDDIWELDVMKQSAKLPKSIQNRLKNLVEEAVGASKSVHTYRGMVTNENDTNTEIWQRMRGRNNNYYYVINRDNKLIQNIREKMNESDVQYLEDLFSAIELTIPLQQIYIDKSQQVVEDTVDIDKDKYNRILMMAHNMIDALSKNSQQSKELLIEDVMKIDIFRRYKKLRTDLQKYYK